MSIRPGTWSPYRRDVAPTTASSSSRAWLSVPHLRLAAAMSGDPEHETAVLRAERRLAETGATSYDALR